METDPNKAPDLAGTVEGWRAWKVDLMLPKYGQKAKLYSVTYGEYFWEPRKVGIAECRACGEDVPGENCSCGFYSAKSLDHLLNMGYHMYNMEHGQLCVIGRIANWGKVIEGSQGWRAQKAYPAELFVPYEAFRLVKPLKEAYGVKVTLKNFLKRPEAIY